MSGEALAEEIESILEQAGFVEISVPQDERSELVREWSPARNLQDYVVSALIEV